VRLTLLIISYLLRYIDKNTVNTGRMFLCIFVYIYTVDYSKEGFGDNKKYEIYCNKIRPKTPNLKIMTVVMPVC